MPWAEETRGLPFFCSSPTATFLVWAFVGRGGGKIKTEQDKKAAPSGGRDGAPKKPTDAELGRALEGRKVLKELEHMGTYEGTASPRRSIRAARLAAS